MAYELKIADDKSMIELCYRGKVDLEERHQALADLVALFKTQQCEKRIIVNIIDIESTLSTTEEFSFGTKLVATKDTAGVRLAILHEAGNRDHEFLGNVVRNRGYSLCEFTSREDAIKWLHE